MRDGFGVHVKIYKFIFKHWADGGYYEGEWK